jgi:group I intron endonuclease
MGYIYIIENKINKKKYIGQTIQKDINQRWNKHKLVNKKYTGTILYNAYKKYGIENFIFKIICICFDEDTDKFEEEYINKYNTLYPLGYNMIEGGKSRKFTPILKKIINDKLKGPNHPNFGKHLKDETKIKLSLKNKGKNSACYGKKLSQEEKIHLSKLAIERYKNCIYNNNNNLIKNKKISNSLKEYYKTNTEIIKNKGNNIWVEQYDLNNNLINTFYSLSEAARSVGVSPNSIIRTSDPKMTSYKTCKGYIWKRI